MAEIAFPIEERMGKVIAGERWGIVPYALYKYQGVLGLKNSEIWFLSWLFMHKWTCFDTYPSLNALHRYTGISRQYIQEIAHGLKVKKYIDIKERRYENGAIASNLYDIQPLISILETKIKADEYSEYRKKEVSATRVAGDIQM